MKSWRWLQIGLTVLQIILEEVHSKHYQDTLLLPLSSIRKHNCECGKLTRRLDSERIGKAKIPDGRIPWLAEMITAPDEYKERNNEVEEEYRICFGVLVNLQTVLFPASCIDKYARKSPMVKLHGAQNKKDSIVETTSALIHPGYRGKYDNDLALVKLKKQIDFNTTKVVPICLPKSTKTYPVPFPTSTNLLSIKATEGDDLNRIPPEEEETLLGSGEQDEDGSRTRPCRNPNPPCATRPCPCPNAAQPKKPYVLENLVARTWFHRRAPGYDYLQKFGRFQLQKMNESTCYSAFPEMLQSKVMCIQQKEIREVVKHKSDFFLRLELGMPVMLTNTSLVKGKPQASSTKFYLEGMRAPGRSGIPMLESRDNIIGLLKVEDYIPWIMENTFDGNFCST